jgi:DNA-binding SARP family transcriptional activator
MLRLTVFGGLSFRTESAEETLSGEVAVQRRGLAVLVLLAASGELGVSRDKLLAFLWPESDSLHARNALRQTLHSLRRELHSPNILVGNEILRLDPHRVVSDLEVFEHAFRAGEMRRAVEVYSGPFLDGFHVSNAPEFERWVEERRAEYRGRVALALESLAAEETRIGRSDLAVPWLRRLASLDPLNAKTAEALIEALAASGNVPGALQHARVYETLLGEELASSPGPSFSALLRRIRSGALTSFNHPVPRESPVAAERPEHDQPQPLRSHDQLTGFRSRLEAALADRYRIDREWQGARDARARTFLAHDTRHDRPVLLKVIRPSVASLIDLARFLQEIRFTARLRHPHILPLLDSGSVDGQPWYTSPFLDATTLRDRLTAEPSISPREAFAIARELAGALDHAHRHDVIHRDVSPENVWIVDGHALLTNLGFARALDVAGTSRLTESGMLIGSPAYMSPEQAAGVAIDARSDIYSLGCVLYEVLAGEPLHTGPTPQAILTKRSLDPAPSILLLHGDAGLAREALLRALSREPSERFPSAGAFAEALGLLTTADAAHSIQEGPVRGALRRWFAWSAIGIVLLILCFALFGNGR